MDYDINLNDVIQLIIRPSKSLIGDAEENEEIDKKKDIKLDSKKMITHVESKYYKVGDLIDVRLEENGAWYEAVVTEIFTRGLKSEKELEENELVFKVRGQVDVCYKATGFYNYVNFSAEHVITFEGESNFSDIRPRSYNVYKTSELEKGMIVLANYNIEETKSRGPW